MNASCGSFMELQNFSVNDGDGIRTIVFFAGCPLRCKWCSNPESWTAENNTAFYEKTCIGCGRCVKVCPEGIGINLNAKGERDKCTSCGKCTEVCPTGSRKRLLFSNSIKEIMGFIDKQKIFYRYSKGGVTFSGGEATMQQDMLRELVNCFYDQALDMAIETSGYFDFDEVKDILGKLNLIFVDLKHMDSSSHKFFTGVGNERILANIARLGELEVPVVIRIPVIKGVNSDVENIRNTARFVKENLPNPKLELLPYHTLGYGKYEALGLDKPSESFGTPSKEELDELCEVIKAEGVEIVSYR